MERAKQLTVTETNSRNKVKQVPAMTYKWFDNRNIREQK
jgi:hypothetical protein